MKMQDATLRQCKEQMAKQESYLGSGTSSASRLMELVWHAASWRLVHSISSSVQLCLCSLVHSAILVILKWLGVVNQRDWTCGLILNIYHSAMGVTVFLKVPGTSMMIKNNWESGQFVSKAYLKGLFPHLHQVLFQLNHYLNTSSNHGCFGKDFWRHIYGLHHWHCLHLKFVRIITENKERSHASWLNCPCIVGIKNSDGYQ